MFNILIKIFMLLMILCGIIMIYDARILIKKFFSFGDQNEGASGLKIFGYMLCMIGGILLFFISK